MAWRGIPAAGGGGSGLLGAGSANAERTLPVRPSKRSLMMGHKPHRGTQHGVCGPVVGGGGGLRHAAAPPEMGVPPPPRGGGAGRCVGCNACCGRQSQLLARGVLHSPNTFLFLLRTALKDQPWGPPTANRQPPPTANRHQPPPMLSTVSVVLCVAHVLPMSLTTKHESGPVNMRFCWVHKGPCFLPPKTRVRLAMRREGAARS